MLRAPAISTEISEGGISAIVTEPLSIGDEVELTFQLTPGNRIYIKAVVRNQFHFRQGFEFVDLTAEQQEEIRRVCASLTPYEGGWY